MPARRAVSPAPAPSLHLLRRSYHRTTPRHFSSLQLLSRGVSRFCILFRFNDFQQCNLQLLSFHNLPTVPGGMGCKPAPVKPSYHSGLSHGNHDPRPTCRKSPLASHMSLSALPFVDFSRLCQYHSRFHPRLVVAPSSRRKSKVTASRSTILHRRKLCPSK